MEPKKYIITFLTISASLVGFYVVMNGRSPIAGLESNVTPSLEGMALSDEEMANLGIDGSGNSNANKNFTELFGGALAQQLINKNSSDPSQMTGLDELLSEQAVKDFTTSNLSQKNVNAFHPKVYAAKYVISDDTSSNAQLAYLRKLKEISASKSKDIHKTSSDILQDISEKKDGSSAFVAAKVYGDIGDEYGRMAVPRNWVEFHRKLLTHFYSAQSMYNAIGNFEEDPMKAYLAIQALPQLDMSAVAIQSLVAQGMKNNNLNL